jgi:hypothetical protein
MNHDSHELQSAALFGTTIERRLSAASPPVWAAMRVQNPVILLWASPRSAVRGHVLTLRSPFPCHIVPSCWISPRCILAARPTLPPPPRQGALLPLGMIGTSTEPMPAICTLSTPLCRPASRRKGSLASPSCGTLMPSATSRRHSLWLSPGDRSLLAPTGNRV